MKNSHLKSRRPSLRTQLLTLYTNGRLPTLGTIRSINQEYVWKPNEWGQAAEAVYTQLVRAALQTNSDAAYAARQAYLSPHLGRFFSQH